MTRRLVALTALFVWALVVPVAAQEPPKQGPETASTEAYYPLKIGTTWHYKVGDKKAVAKVVEHEKQGNITVAKIETSMDGMKVAEEQVAHNTDGIVRVSYGGQKSKPAVLFWKAGAKAGDSWDVKTELGGTPIEGKFTAGEERKVKVGAGEFDCLTSTGDFTLQGNNQLKFVYWFAKDKGIVKLKMTVAGQDILMELDQFEAGK